MRTLVRVFDILLTLLFVFSVIAALNYILMLLSQVLYMRDRLKRIDEKEAQRKEYYAPKIDDTGVWTMQLYNN